MPGARLGAIIFLLCTTYIWRFIDCVCKLFVDLSIFLLFSIALHDSLFWGFGETAAFRRHRFRGVVVSRGAVGTHCCIGG